MIAAWDHEAIANYHGEKCFQHPGCITRSILKTRVVRRENGESTVEVTAHGYRGVKRKLDRAPRDPSRHHHGANTGHTFQVYTRAPNAPHGGAELW